MQKVLSSDIWKEIGKRAKASERRKAAIAYVTKDQIGFRPGDILIADASHRAIASGQTGAPLLRELVRKGVAVYSQEGLHAKVLVLDSFSVIGSANMSLSSDGLIEVAFISDSAVAAAGVESFITQLAMKRAKLTPALVEELCKIKVIRTGWTKGARAQKRRKRIRSLGNRTWIVGVNELLRAPPADEQRHIDRASAHLNEQLGTAEEEYQWIRWGKSGKFAHACRAGDTLVQIYNKRNGTRTVTFSVPVLLKRSEPRWTRFYLGDTPKKADLSWTKFQAALRKIKYTRKVGPHSVQQVDPAITELLQKQLRRSARASARKTNA